MKYHTKTLGIGGRIRQRIEDFYVEEIPKRIEAGEEFTIFWMEKFNWDTHKAISAIANKLHAGSSRFGFAGTKDKRAVTKQRVSAWHVKPEDLRKITLKDIKISDFDRAGRKIRLGDLEGNKFIITVRDVNLSEEEIRERLGNVFKEMEKGIPNLFGPQRFGEVRPITHLVGKDILLGDVESAVFIYITKVFPDEPDDVKKIREFLANNFNSKGFNEALNGKKYQFPKRLSYERSMIDYLYMNPYDYVGALRRLPIKLMKMFINAYQSYIWNNIVETTPLKFIKIPLAGYDTKLDESNPIHMKLLKLMEKDRISAMDFEISGIPELKTSGSERNMVLIPKNFEIKEIKDDEFNEGKKSVKISFDLPSGSYATIVLDEIMKL